MFAYDKLVNAIRAFLSAAGYNYKELTHKLGGRVNTHCFYILGSCGAVSLCLHLTMDSSRVTHITLKAPVELYDWARFTHMDKLVGDAIAVHCVGSNICVYSGLTEEWYSVRDKVNTFFPLIHLVAIVGKPLGKREVEEAEKLLEELRREVGKLAAILAIA